MNEEEKKLQPEEEQLVKKGILRDKKLEIYFQNTEILNERIMLDLLYEFFMEKELKEINEIINIVEVEQDWDGLQLDDYSGLLIIQKYYEDFKEENTEFDREKASELMDTQKLIAHTKNVASDVIKLITNIQLDRRKMFEEAERQAVMDQVIGTPREPQEVKEETDL